MGTNRVASIINRYYLLINAKRISDIRIIWEIIRTFAKKIRKMYFTGIIIAICTFLTIGIWHPIVIKTEYYWGTRPWIVYLVIGLVAIVAALFIENTLISAVVGVFGASALWGIGELFEQKKRVERGWFPKNPKRK